MSKCRYPKKVIKNGIDILEDAEGKCCYKLVIPICDKGDKNILVICRRPKPIGLGHCSRLSSRVSKYILNKFEGVASITCVCLFASYELENISENYSLEKENKNVLKEEINKASVIIAAWGEPYPKIEDKFNSRITYVYEYIRDAMLDSKNKKDVVRVGELTKKGYPKHYLAWKDSDEISPLI